MTHYKELATTNLSVGIHAVFQYVAEIVPIFFPLLLFALFIVYTVGSFLLQKEQTGNSNLFSSLVVGGYLTAITAFVINLIPGLVNPLVPVITLVISLILTLVFFVTRRKR